MSEFQSPYFPPPFHSSATAGLTATQQTAQEVFAAQAASAPHLVSAAAAASADPYNVTNLHNFQTSQVNVNIYFLFSREVDRNDKLEISLYLIIECNSNLIGLYICYVEL